jgi:hypothetical protein
MTTTWTISTLDRETATGFVTTAHWRATAVDGDYTATIYSTSSWPSAGTSARPWPAITSRPGAMWWLWWTR